MPRDSAQVSLARPVGPRLVRVGPHNCRPAKKGWRAACLFHSGTPPALGWVPTSLSWFSQLSTGEKKLESDVPVPEGNFLSSPVGPGSCELVLTFVDP